MKTNAIPSRICAASLGLLVLLAASPASAQGDKPVTDQTITAVDVAATPIDDLNLRKDDIPPLLLAARQAPYAAEGMKRCSRIAAAVGELDAVLGPDLDVAEQKDENLKPGKVAKWAVARFIPFRGLIREISGANRHKDALDDAIVAGMMRRAFLKGLGQARGCRYPGHPADKTASAALAAPSPAAQATSRD